MIVLDFKKEMEELTDNSDEEYDKGNYYCSCLKK